MAVSLLPTMGVVLPTESQARVENKLVSNRNTSVTLLLAFAPWIVVYMHLHALMAPSQEESTFHVPQLRTVVQEINDVPQERTIFQTGKEAENTFFICLLIVDNNHVLAKWLAY
jgi:hypothetical protein